MTVSPTARHTRHVHAHDGQYGPDGKLSNPAPVRAHCFIDRPAPEGPPYGYLCGHSSVLLAHRP